VNVSAIDEQIKEQERLRTVEETKATSGQAERLQKIKAEGAELVTKCMAYNSGLEKKFNNDWAKYDNFNKAKGEINSSKDSIINNLNNLVLNEALNQDLVDKLILNIDKSIKYPENIDKPEAISNPNDIILNGVHKNIYIDISADNKVNTRYINHYTGEAKELLDQVLLVKERYLNCLNDEPEKADVQKFNTEIERLTKAKSNAEATNRIVKAIDSFHEWRAANGKVIELKNKYAKMLGDVDTGVEGLKIIPVENEEKLEIFLMYNGAYDHEYFGNQKGEYRKLSSYSGTQKPVICLLIQNYLLSKKPKAMRYMYIDNIPMDDNTVALLERMCGELDLTIFLNYTGTFSKESLNDGEILIENGEVLFN
jgi:hypothetical protein